MTVEPQISSLQDQVEQQEAGASGKFGTFKGVFTPTLLTILGVIMYLREGWVVGNAGLMGAWLIIMLAIAITAFTALSMSSITTNIRIGAGGAFSIISQSLGLEIGGSVGIPLYLSQVLAVAMYIMGFREGWASIFPEHPAVLVDFATFALLFAIAFTSANLAFRIQYVIMAVIALSLLSVLGSVFTGAMQYEPTWWGSTPGNLEAGFGGVDFWLVFAVFFPATTGIMAGANMSGELKNPQRNIPLGTISAIIISSSIYLALAYWLARVASPDELVNNYNVMIDKALWGPLVLAGLLGATFSSGLSSLVGAPRILQALSQHGILPASHFFVRQSKNGEPRNAIWFSALIVAMALMLRDLNSIAPLITMFFLITYAMINVVVFFEQTLGLISFRPKLRIPRIIPFLGASGSIFAMFIINPIFSLIAVVLVLVFYGILLRQQLKAPFGDMRSGLFVSLAEWAAKRVNDLPIAQERAWKPNLLVPVEEAAELRGSFQFLLDLAHPRGSIKLVGLAPENESSRLAVRLPELAKAFREQGVYTTATMITGDNFSHGLQTSLQALSGTFFRPNILFLTQQYEESPEREDELAAIISKACEYRLGIFLLIVHPKARLGRRKSINVWVSDQSPNWRLSMQLGNLDLALLTAYLLRQNWQGTLRLVSAIPQASEVRNAEIYIQNLTDLARLPSVEIHIMNTEFDQAIQEAPSADLNIFCIPDTVNQAFMHRMVRETRGTCAFVRDAGDENIFA